MKIQKPAKQFKFVITNSVKSNVNINYYYKMSEVEHFHKF